MASPLAGRRSRVFRVRTEEGRELALKLAADRHRNTLRSLKRAPRKAARLSRAGLASAGLVESGRNYLLQEWISGTRGDAWLRRWREEGAPPDSLPLRRLGELLRRAIRRRVYVRDLNRNNLVWDGRRWVIIDCGSVKRQMSRRKTEELYRREWKREWPELSAALRGDFPAWL